jgi:hypothetical protein
LQSAALKIQRCTLIRRPLHHSAMPAAASQYSGHVYASLAARPAARDAAAVAAARDAAAGMAGISMHGSRASLPSAVFGRRQRAQPCSGVGSERSRARASAASAAVRFFATLGITRVTARDPRLEVVDRGGAARAFMRDTLARRRHLLTLRAAMARLPESHLCKRSSARDPLHEM